MTTGRGKIAEAFSLDGSLEIPAVVCYEGIFYRDHWGQFTSCPWWYALETDIDRQLRWRSDVIASIGQDWFVLPMSVRREDRKHLRIERRPEGVFRCDKRN